MADTLDVLTSKVNNLTTRVGVLERAVAPPVVPPVGKVESPDLTTIPPAPLIVDASLRTLTVTGGKVVVDGATIAETSGVVLLKKVDRPINTSIVKGVYQKNSSGNWYGPITPTKGGAQIPGDPSLAAPIPPIPPVSTPGVPQQAAAAGFNTLTFGPNLVLGSNWHHFKWYGGGDSNITQVTPTSLRFAGGVNGYNAHCASAKPGGSSGFTGTGFGGGGYFEFTLKWDNSYNGWGNSGSNGWPSAWAWDLETYLGRQGEHTPFTRTIEVDVMEAWGDNSFTSVLHSWNDIANISSDGIYTSLPGGDHNQLHRFGFLWVPATGSSKGKAEFYVDDQRMNGSGGSWDQHNDNLNSAPAIGTTAFNILDVRHLVFLLGSGSGNPMTVTAFKAWQKDGSKNMVGT